MVPTACSSLPSATSLATLARRRPFLRRPPLGMCRSSPPIFFSFFLVGKSARATPPAACVRLVGRGKRLCLSPFKEPVGGDAPPAACFFLVNRGFQPLSLSLRLLFLSETTGAFGPCFVSLLSRPTGAFGPCLLFQKSQGGSCVSLSLC